MATGTSSGKQLQDRCENRAGTIEADEYLLAPQQLASNSKSSNFNSNINRTQKLPKSFTTTVPTIDGISQRFELFGDFFQKGLKNHQQLTEDDKTNYFHSLRPGVALQTFKDISSLSQESLGEIMNDFRRKYVKPQSMATARHKFQ